MLFFVFSALVLHRKAKTANANQCVFIVRVNGKAYFAKV